MTENPDSYPGFYAAASAEVDRQTFIAIALSLLASSAVAVGMLLTAHWFA